MVKFNGFTTTTGKHHGKAKDSGFELKGFHSGTACESSLCEKRPPHQCDQYAGHGIRGRTSILAETFL
jgi:hypothetical protein